MGNERPVSSRIRVRSGPGSPPSVDGHPGWVQQSVRQHAALCAVLIAAQGMITGLGPVLAQAKSAAWWCMALGVVAGFLLWLPIWAIMRADKARTLDEAFSAAFGTFIGGAFSMTYVLLLFMDVVIAINAVSIVVCQRMLIDADERVVSLTILVAIALMLFRNQVRGFSRFVWLFRITILGMFTASMIFLFENVRLDHLFPLMGDNVSTTLWQIPVAAGGMSGIFLLGLLPKETGSAQPVKMSTGVFTLLAGGIVSFAYTLLTNLCIPPLAIPRFFSWGSQIMLSAEFNQHRFFRLVYLIVTILQMLLSIGAGIAGGGMLAQGAFRTKTWRWPLGVFSVLLAITCIMNPQVITSLSVQAMVWRFPVAMIPAWLAWIVLTIKKRKKKGGAA